jgi:hypothetical protein
LFLSSAPIGGSEAYRPAQAGDRGGERYNGVVAAAGGEDDEVGEERRARPTFLTYEAKAVLVVWLAVTLVLVVTYVLVLLLV